jgi:integrase
VSEVLGLRRDNVDAGYLTVQRQKGSQRTRQVLLVNLDAYLSAPTYRLFPCSRSSVYLHFRKAAAKVGLHKDLQHPHCCKHSAAHWLLDGGANLATTSTYLGHTSLSSTAQYLNVSDHSASLAAQEIIGTL